MDIATLSVFRTVAQEQGITRAAELLGRVPSNVTTRIQQLEAEIGATLFLRDKKRMSLTPEGQTFLEYAERILNLAQEAQQRVNPASPTGILRIGSMESTVASRLPALLAAFCTAWPQVKLELSTSPTRQLVSALEDHRIDAALIAVPSGEWWLGEREIDKTPVFREELVLLLPKTHPDITHADDIEINALAAFAPGCTYRMLAEEWLTRFGERKAPLNIQEVGSYHAMYACSAAGASISIMPRSVLNLMGDASDVKIHPLMNVDTHLACRRGYDTPAFREFRDILVKSGNIAQP
ncbi:LysR substrate-binding domain-containing protein [Thalassospira marina]|uniref:LysR family transcriptional regulator n=1 Tax=Thalassospira marina TaxID=2048283 RepID=A0ABM6Q7C2_9PROT|nr:LysR substrate-binding domain-containing protein [Thalassospira marina]AUG52432.1 LysR family transcriptional regulator [Thalassospira marina]